MSDNKQIEKALEKWVKVCPFSRSETPKQEAFVAGYEAGIREERERVIEEVEGICDKVIESWDNVGDSVSSFYVQDVLDWAQKLKQETK